MTSRERAIATLKLLLCSDAEPSPSAVAVLAQAFEECAGQARLDALLALGDAMETLESVQPVIRLVKEDKR